MKRISYPELCAYLFLSLVAVSSRAEIRTPNVVILFADDMGYGDLGIQNPNSKIPTPHLDQLAREGMRFSDGHSSSGICTPSRYALLTGRYHWRKMHGIVHAFGESVFDAEEQTLPEMLQEQGYYTACIGKWHLGWDWNAIRKHEAGPVTMDARGANQLPHFSEYNWDQSVLDGPLAHGFDHYFGDTVINFPPYAWIEDDKLTQAPTLQKDEKLWKPLQEGNWECRVGPMVEGWDPYEVLPELTRRAVSFVEGRQDEEEPFFLFIAFPAPHAPIVPAAEFEGTSEAGPYGDFMVQTDWSCGQILDALKRSGLEEDTIVIFTADNGSEHYAYPRALKYDHWSSEPFRGLKRDTYEGGHHVPFLVKWPGVVEAGSVSEAIISQVDLMATVRQAVGGKIQDGAAEDSFNQLPVWKGESESVRTEIVYNTLLGNYAMRYGKWVLIDAPSGNHNRTRPKVFEKTRGYSTDDDEEFELYDLESDPGQYKNLSKQLPEKVRELREMLKRIRKLES